MRLLLSFERSTSLEASLNFFSPRGNRFFGISEGFAGVPAGDLGSVRSLERLSRGSLTRQWQFVYAA